MGNVFFICFSDALTEVLFKIILIEYTPDSSDIVYPLNSSRHHLLRLIALFHKLQRVKG